MTASSSSCRFVVLRHDGIPDPHYDLMFDLDGVSNLATWRCAEWPLTPPTVLHRLPDHRREYLTYEGPISNNRGHVTRIAAGPCTIHQDSSDSWTIAFSAPLGTLNLRRLANDHWRAQPP